MKKLIYSSKLYYTIMFDKLFDFKSFFNNYSENLLFLEN